MAVEIGALRALLSLDTAAFEKGSKRATASMNKVQANLAKMGKRFDTIGKDLTKKVSLPIVAAAGVALKSSMSMIDSQAKMAQSLGTTTESMQVLGRAADLAGVSTGELEQVAMQLTKRLSQAAAGGGPAVKALDQLGLSAEALTAMPLDERIRTINQAIEDTVPAAERAATAAKLFGDRAGLVASRLDSATIKTAADEIARFGVAVSDVDADKIEAANDAISGLGLVSRGLANQLTVALAPTLEAIAKKVADVGAWFANLSPEAKRFAGIAVAVTAAAGPAAIALGFVATGLAAIASPIGLAIAGLATVGAIGGYLVAQWGGVGAIVDGVKEAWSRFSEGISGYIAPALESLKAAWDNIKGAFANLVEAFGSLFQLFSGSGVAVSTSGLESLNNVLGTMAGLAFRGIASGLELIARGLETATGMIAAAVKGDWSGVLDELKDFGAWFAKTDTVQRITKFAEDVGRGLLKMAEDAGLSVDDITAVFASFPEDIRSALADVGQVIGDLAADMVAGVKQIAADLYEAALDIGTQIVEGIKAGLDAKWQELKAKLTSLSNLLPEWMRRPLEVQSPSKVFAEIGRFVVDGLIVGLDDRAQDAIDRAAKLGRDIANATKDAAEPIFRTIADGLAKGDLGSIGSGLLGQAQTAFSDKLQNVFSGAQTFGSIFSEGFKGVGSAISGIASGATGIMSGIGGALSAAMPVIGAVTAGISLVKGLVGTTTKLTNAIEGTFDKTGLIGGGEYDLKQNDGLFSSGVEKNFEAWKGSWAEDIGRHADEVMKRIASTVATSIEDLGLEVQDIVHKFDFQFEEGSLPDGHLYKVVEAEAAKAGEAMLHASLAAAGLARDGETGAQTLSILNRALTVTNDYFDTLGWTLHEVSAIGAGAARQFSELFGGIEGMDSALSAYHQAVYTEGERMRTLGRQLGEMFADMGMAALPETRDGIRSIVDGLMEVGNTETAARIIQISPALVQYIEYMREQAAAATGAASATGVMTARLREVAAEIGTRFAAGMEFVVQNFYSTSQQLEFYSARASAAFQAAGLAMPATADAFRAAAQSAAADVQRILGMVAQGQASLADLERAKAQQLAIIELADEAKQVYDLQDQANQERLAAANRAAEAAAARAAEIESQRASALAASSRSITTSVARTVSSLDQLKDKIGGAMADITKQASRAGTVSRDASARIVAMAISTGKAWEASFLPALDVLKDIDASRFQTRVDFDRMRAETGNLLASAQSSITAVSETPMTAREQREYHNESVQRLGAVEDILDRLLSLERQRGIA